MKYTRTFTGSKCEKTQQAWEAVQEYLTDKQMRSLINISLDVRHRTRSSPKTIYRRAQFICGFVGVEGYYPVRGTACFLMGKI